jgi:DnaJ-class molecular chaperone
MTFKELNLARAVFGLPERATLQEIKARHRELVKLHHPDSGRQGDPETILKVNTAYQVLLEYVTHFSFSFGEEEFYEQNAEERLLRQFMDEQYWRER